MSKESSIKVFAENASGTRPANAIPVWVDNISAIGGGACEEQINELSAAIDYVSANAGEELNVTTNDGSFVVNPNTAGKPVEIVYPKTKGMKGFGEITGWYQWAGNSGADPNNTGNGIGIITQCNDGYFDFEQGQEIEVELLQPVYGCSYFQFIYLNEGYTSVNGPGATQYITSQHIGGNNVFSAGKYKCSAYSNPSTAQGYGKLLGLWFGRGASVFGPSSIDATVKTMTESTDFGYQVNLDDYLVLNNGVLELSGNNSQTRISNSGVSSYNGNPTYEHSILNGQQIILSSTTAKTDLRAGHINITAGAGGNFYGAVDVSNNDIKLSSYNNTATYSLTSMAQILPKSGDFLNTKKYISFGSQGAVLADKFERLSAVSSYESSFTKVGTLNSATEGVSAFAGYFTSIQFPITALDDKETFKANWKYSYGTGTFYVLNEPYSGGGSLSTASQVYSGNFKIVNGGTDSFYVTGLTPNEEYYVYLNPIGYNRNQSAMIDVDYGTSTFASATVYMNGIVVPDNDKVNNMASDLTAMTNKINELEQVLQTYSGQWLIGG